MNATWSLEPCPLGCGKDHPRLNIPAKRGPAKPYDGPYVSPLRSETPRDGRESSLSEPPSGRSRSRSSQAASRRAPRRLGAAR